MASIRPGKLLNRSASADDAGVVAIMPRQIYIIPTWLGLMFAILVIGMLVGANNYGINLGFMLAFLLAGIGLAAMLQTWRNLVGLKLIPAAVSSVFCGDPAIFVLHVENLRRTDRAGLQFTHRQEVKNKIRDTGMIVAVDIAPDSRKEIRYELVTQKRGVIRNPKWTIFSYFPMHLFYTWAYFQTDQECWVYPAPVDRSRNLRSLFKERFTEMLDAGGEIDFHGHRKYQSGDDLRRIDWKALARQRGELVKEFRAEEKSEIWLDWDDVKATDPEEKLSILCRAALDLHAVERPFGLCLPGTTIDPDAGPAHLQSVLRRLAEFPAAVSG